LRRKLYEARTTMGDESDIGIGKLRPLFRVEQRVPATLVLKQPLAVVALVCEALAR
jgi:hypothetical protein